MDRQLMHGILISLIPWDCRASAVIINEELCQSRDLKPLWVYNYVRYRF